VCSMEDIANQVLESLDNEEWRKMMKKELKHNRAWMDQLAAHAYVRREEARDLESDEVLLHEIVLKEDGITECEDMRSRVLMELDLIVLKDEAVTRGISTPKTMDIETRVDSKADEKLSGQLWFQNKCNSSQVERVILRAGLEWQPAILALEGSFLAFYLTHQNADDVSILRGCSLEGIKPESSLLKSLSKQINSDSLFGFKLKLPSNNKMCLVFETMDERRSWATRLERTSMKHNDNDLSIEGFVYKRSVSTRARLGISAAWKRRFCRIMLTGNGWCISFGDKCKSEEDFRLDLKNAHSLRDIDSQEANMDIRLGQILQITLKNGKAILFTTHRINTWKDTLGLKDETPDNGEDLKSLSQRNTSIDDYDEDGNSEDESKTIISELMPESESEIHESLSLSSSSIIESLTRAPPERTETFSEISSQKGHDVLSDERKNAAQADVLSTEGILKDKRAPCDDRDVLIHERITEDAISCDKEKESLAVRELWFNWNRISGLASALGPQCLVESELHNLIFEMNRLMIAMHASGNVFSGALIQLCQDCCKIASIVISTPLKQATPNIVEYANQIGTMDLSALNVEAVKVSQEVFKLARACTSRLFQNIQDDIEAMSDISEYLSDDFTDCEEIVFVNKEPVNQLVIDKLSAQIEQEQFERSLLELNTRLETKSETKNLTQKSNIKTKSQIEISPLERLVETKSSPKSNLPISSMTRKEELKHTENATTNSYDLNEVSPFEMLIDTPSLGKSKSAGGEISVNESVKILKPIESPPISRPQQEKASLINEVVQTKKVHLPVQEKLPDHRLKGGWVYKREFKNTKWVRRYMTIESVNINNVKVFIIAFRKSGRSKVLDEMQLTGATIEKLGKLPKDSQLRGIPSTVGSCFETSITSMSGRWISIVFESHELFVEWNKKITEVMDKQDFRMSDSVSSKLIINLDRFTAVREPSDDEGLNAAVLDYLEYRTKMESLNTIGIGKSSKVLRLTSPCKPPVKEVSPTTVRMIPNTEFKFDVISKTVPKGVLSDVTEWYMMTEDSRVLQSVWLKVHVTDMVIQMHSQVERDIPFHSVVSVCRGTPSVGLLNTAVEATRHQIYTNTSTDDMDERDQFIAQDTFTCSLLLKLRSRRYNRIEALELLAPNAMICEQLYLLINRNNK